MRFHLRTFLALMGLAPIWVWLQFYSSVNSLLVFRFTAWTLAVGLMTAALYGKGRVRAGTIGAALHVVPYAWTLPDPYNATTVAYGAAMMLGDTASLTYWPGLSAAYSYLISATLVSSLIAVLIYETLGQPASAHSEQQAQ